MSNSQVKSVSIKSNYLPINYNNQIFLIDEINKNFMKLKETFINLKDIKLKSDLNTYYKNLIKNINEIVSIQNQTIQYILNINSYCEDFNLKLQKKCLIDNKVVEDFFSKEKKDEFISLRQLISRLEKDMNILKKDDRSGCFL